jgi:hypothetical protein
MAIEAAAIAGRPGTAPLNPAAFDEAEGSGEGATRGVSLWGNDGLSFGDFLDTINPLQHLPIISSVYRWLSEDDLAAGPRLIGGAIYGGLVGLGVSAVNVVTESATGRDIGGHFLALFESDEETPGIAAGGTQFAELDTATDATFAAGDELAEIAPASGRDDMLNGYATRTDGKPFAGKSLPSRTVNPLEPAMPLDVFIASLFGSDEDETQTARADIRPVKAAGTAHALYQQASHAGKAGSRLNQAA